MIWYDMIWYDMIWYDMIWYDIRKFYHMISYDIIWYHMISKSYDVISYDIIIWYDIRKFAENKHTNRQTHREFNYRGHSYPLWIVGGSGPIFIEFFMDVLTFQPNIWYLLEILEITLQIILTFIFLNSPWGTQRHPQQWLKSPQPFTEARMSATVGHTKFLRFLSVFNQPNPQPAVIPPPAPPSTHCTRH